MTLSYRIIWVDDTPDWVDSVKSEITEHLEDMGYEPNVEVLEQGDDLEQRCTGADLDLIIVDYNLPKENGDVLISKLRGAGNFTEIVFYSQDQPSQNLIGVMDGVFHCQRDGAVETIKRVVDQTLHKMKDLGVVRGLVIAAAIDLEVQMEELMISVFGKKGTLFRKRVLEKQLFDFAKKSAFLQGTVKDRIGECDGNGLKKELEDAKRILSEFDKEVVDHRNILAHSRRVERDGKIVLEGINTRTKQVSFDEEWLATMRANLRKHQENLDALERLLQNGDD